MYDDTRNNAPADPDDPDMPIACQDITLRGWVCAILTSLTIWLVIGWGIWWAVTR